MSMNEMASDVKLVVALAALSADELSEEELALWFTEHLV
jgi:dsDNA-binding SOS-regulon protein